MTVQSSLAPEVQNKKRDRRGAPKDWPEISYEERLALFEKHRWLAPHFVSKFCKSPLARQFFAHDPAIAPADLVQEAYHALWYTTERYNPTRAAFTTYAYFWMRNFVLRTLRNGGRIRIPTNVWDGLNLPKAVPKGANPFHLFAYASLDQLLSYEHRERKDQRQLHDIVGDECSDWQSFQQVAARFFDELDAAQLLERLIESENLNDCARDTLKAVLLYGYRQADIAKHLGVSQSDVCELLRHALAVLQAR